MMYDVPKVKYFRNKFGTTFSLPVVGETCKTWLTANHDSWSKATFPEISEEEYQVDRWARAERKYLVRSVERHASPAQLRQIADIIKYPVRFETK